MPGLAKTNDFMLGTATVMIGAVADLYDLNPLENSIGLVKNFTATAEPAYTELTQGVKGSIVHSLLTSNPVRCSMEAFEYTAQNLAYSLGLESGLAMTAQTVETTTTAAVDGDASPRVAVLPVTSATGLTAGVSIMIINDEEDDFVVRKIVSVSSLNLTLDRPLPDVAMGAKVRKVNAIDVGSKDDQPFYSAKVAGKLANGDPLVLLIPKIRIVKGFNLAFTVSDYANLPIEFTVYDPVSTDPFYADFKKANARIYKR